MRCPCRKKSEARTYAACCQPYHAGLRPAPTAEALMRSRYSAYALRDTGYLLVTWHPSTRPSHLDLEEGVEWLQLRIITHQTVSNRAMVEFIARSRMNGQAWALRESSRFVNEGGRWLYVDGDVG